MHPVLFQLGPITIYTYGLFVATGLLLGITLALRQARREGLNSQLLLDMFFYIILAAIIGARILYVIQNVSSYRGNPLAVFKLWEGGLVFHGGLLGAIPVAWFFIKRYDLSFWSVFDVVAPSLAIGQALGRIGCFFAGCCYGIPTDVPWAVTFTHPRSLAPLGIALHPTQLYSSLGCFIIFFVLVGLRKHRSFSGQLACLYLLFHSVFRFSVEFLRGDPKFWFWNHTLSHPQVISVGIFGSALVCYWYCRKHYRL